MLIGDIAKFESLEDGSLVIEGIASTPTVDYDGEVISPDAIRKALPEYLRKGSVREMHVTAAGKPLAACVDDDGKLHLKARIFDPNTITKIKEGILKEFSVGGRTIKKVGNVITELLMKEISVVDHGCNPQTFFNICKFDNSNSPNTQTQMKDELLKALKEPEVIAALAAMVPKAVEAPKVEDLEKSLGIADLKKSLETLTTKATEASAAAQKAERDAIVESASREGKVIPLSNDAIAKMDNTILKELVAGLPKTVSLKKTLAPVVIPNKEDERATFLEQKRAEGAEALTKKFASMGLQSA